VASDNVLHEIIYVNSALTGAAGVHPVFGKECGSLSYEFHN
jgi:hypothetical protein